MARLYANGNYPLPVVEELRRLGHDVLTSHEAGRANKKVPDEDVFAFAIRERRAVVTINRRHFFRLARMNPDHFGVIACTYDADYARQAAAIHARLATTVALDGPVVRINRPS